MVRVTNVGAGHRLPTGVSDFRQMWLQVTVTDATGKVVLSSGKLDAKGNLDPDARLFQKVLGDKDAHAVGLEFWRYGRMNEDTRIPPDGHRDETYELPAGHALSGQGRRPTDVPDVPAVAHRQGA